MPKTTGRSGLPYVPSGSGYTQKNDVGRRLTFTYFRASGTEGNLVGDDESKDLYMVLRAAGARSINFRINLTDMTEDELQAMKTFLLEGIHVALEVARARDEAARENFETGDGSDPRSHRPVPSLSQRTGPLLEYIQGVRDRPQGVPAVDGEPTEAD